ncbi:DUF2935 domain-containing protein [Neobacillus pocheonensis]|uniref:DUF2935 domain-containing protein n=1 Tax=Neobacillus pocheonensis TaxID=363869 RepID=UPI003D290818
MNTAICVWDEHLFWLEILQDHAIFVRDHLSKEEEEGISIAERFIQSFGTLLHNLQQLNPALSVSSTEQIAFAKQSYTVSFEYYRFEGNLEHYFPETCYFIKKLAEFAPELYSESTHCSLRKPSFS